MHQCIFGDGILCQCCYRESKLEYSSSRLSVYIWRFCVGVCGAGEASLNILLQVLVSIFRDCVSVLGQGKQV
jgi:hypothetical protein